jgi:6-pyruvoyltetrahydropterin/6-carboxytetrahydropterin synthase
MWSIDKQFSFCYGHRVYVQKLNQEYCGEDNKAKCRHLHGHEGLVHVFLEGGKLNDQSMVTDFKHLGWLKSFIDDTIDHKFIIDYNDPMFKQLVVDVFQRAHGAEYDNMNTLSFMGTMTESVCVPGTNFKVGSKIKLDGIDPNSSEYETLEGYLIVNFVPTSERLSQWMYYIVDSKMSKLGVSVSQIDWFETPKSRATFRSS